MATIHKSDGDINLTNIIFNEDLKTLIKNIQSQINMNLTIDESMNAIESYEIKQSQIREFASKYYKKNLKNQDYFAVVICCINNMDNCNNFQDIFNSKNYEIIDWDLVEQDDESGEINIPYTQCGCGHKVKCCNISFIINKITSKSVMVGCECVKKNKIINIDDFNEFMKKKNARNKILKKKQKLIKEEQKLVNIISEQNKNFLLWKTEYEKKTIYELLIGNKWSRLMIKLVKHNNKVYLTNEKNKIQQCKEYGYNYGLV